MTSNIYCIASDVCVWVFCDVSYFRSRCTV